MMTRLTTGCDTIVVWCLVLSISHRGTTYLPRTCSHAVPCPVYAWVCLCGWVGAYVLRVRMCVCVCVSVVGRSLALSSSPRWQMAMMQGEAAIAKMIRDEPTGMRAGCDRVVTLAKEAAARYQVPMSRVILGGFSQGSMAAIDAALALDETCAGVVALSSFPHTGACSRVLSLAPSAVAHTHTEK